MTTPHREMLKHDPVAEAIVASVSRVRHNWRKYVPYALLAVLVLCVAWYVYRGRANEPLTASTALGNARTAEALEAVARLYPNTYAGPAALAQLGALALQQTNYAQAYGHFQRLVSSAPQSYLVPAAQLAMVKCRVAQANEALVPQDKQNYYADAEQVLRRELLYNRDHYAAPMAQLELVRILYATGRPQEAWQELEVWQREIGQNYMASMADGLRETLMRMTGAATNMMAQQAAQEAAQQTAQQAPLPTLPQAAQQAPPQTPPQAPRQAPPQTPPQAPSPTLPQAP